MVFSRIVIYITDNDDTVPGESYTNKPLRQMWETLDLSVTPKFPTLLPYTEHSVMTSSVWHTSLRSNRM